MNDRNDIISDIEDKLGDGADRDLAERVYEALRARGDVYYTDANGLVLNPDVDLLAVAADGT